MKKPLAQSLIFHCVIVIILIITSWGIFARKEVINEEPPITVQLMPNIPLGAKTNVRPAPKNEKPTPPKPQAPKPPAPKPPTPVPKPPAPQAVTPTPQPKKIEPKPVTKVEPKKQEKPKDETAELNALLTTLDKPEPAKAKSAETKNTDENSLSAAKFDETAAPSRSEVDYITKLITDQLKHCWSPPAGAINDKNLIVVVDFDISQDGIMKFVGYENTNNNSDPLYLAAERAAKAAILDPECNPLHPLPPMDKYNIWKEMTLTFDPKLLN